MRKTRGCRCLLGESVHTENSRSHELRFGPSRTETGAGIIETTKPAPAICSCSVGLLTRFNSTHCFVMPNQWLQTNDHFEFLLRNARMRNLPESYT